MEIEISMFYVDILNIMLFTAIYGFPLPCGMLIGIAGLGLCYWAHKFKMLRMSYVPHKIGFELAYAQIYIMKALPFLYACSMLFFCMLVINEKSNIMIMHILFVVGTFLYIIMPHKEIIRYV
jgi:hypothetical protein